MTGKTVLRSRFLGVPSSSSHVARMFACPRGGSNWTPCNVDTTSVKSSTTTFDEMTLRSRLGRVCFNSPTRFRDSHRASAASTEERVGSGVFNLVSCGLHVSRGAADSAIDSKSTGVASFRPKSAVFESPINDRQAYHAFRTSQAVSFVTSGRWSIRVRIEYQCTNAKTAFLGELTGN